MRPKIFISSTCYDLIDMRHEIRNFLDELNLNPILSDQSNSEFEVSKDNNSIESCLINLRSADIVIFILSKRYGPKLGAYGFEDLSATHLEYNEAKKMNKHILFFVRDKLEADYLGYKKTKDNKSLSWIRDGDISLFDIIEQHKALIDSGTNNWYWTFKSSIDVKERIAFELKSEISKTRLNHIIESGSAPFISVQAGWEKMIERSVSIRFQLENIGVQPAIDPLIVITRAESYQQVLDENHYDNFLNYQLWHIKSLKSNEQNFDILQNFNITQEEISFNRASFVIEIIYKTIFGDLISDIVEMKINTSLFPKISIHTQFMIKRYVSNEAFQRLITDNIAK